MYSSNKLFLIILIIGVFSCKKVFPQKVFVGYPQKEILLNVNDIVIISPLPWSLDGHFYSERMEYFTDMKSFMKNNSHFKFEIYLNAFYINRRFNKRITEYQAKKLDDLLKKDTTFTDIVTYSLIPSGQEKTLFTRKQIDSIENKADKKRCEVLNFRVEIKLVKKD